MKLVCLDRDGTINVDVGYLGRNPSWREEIEIYDDIIPAIKLLNDREIPVVVITNQSGVARGYFSIDRVREVNEELDRRIRSQGACIDGWFFCPFVDEELLRLFDLPLTWLDTENMRKPATGMVEAAIKKLGLTDPEVFFIGDKAVDAQTGINMKGTGILVQREHNDTEIGKARNMDDVIIVESVTDAVRTVI